MLAGAREWRGRIVEADYESRKLIVQPVAPYPAALAGRYVRITNEFSDCTHLIEAAENSGDACQLTLNLDPRLCEGPVTSTSDNAIASGVTLQLAGLRYCHGKTLTNEDGSTVYRVSGVTGRKTAWIDPDKHGSVSAEKLKRQFGDLDGDGIARFLIFDYGVGDEVSVPTAVSLHKTAKNRWSLETSTNVLLTLPDHPQVNIEPGTSGSSGKLTWSSSTPGQLDILLVR
jgi:hypothetical protein